MNKIITFIKENTKYLMLVTIIFLIILLMLQKCTSDNKEAQMDSDRNGFSMRETEFKEIKTKDNTTIYAQEQAIAKAGETIETQADIIEHLKKVNTAVSMTVKTEFKDVKVPIDRPVYKDIDGNIYLKTPAKFNKIAQWYSISGEIQSGGNIKFDTLSFITKPSIFIGLRKQTFLQKITFQKAKREIVFKDENPFSRVISMENVTIEEKKHRLGLGLSAGYALTLTGPQPYIGIGINYQIIRF